MDGLDLTTPALILAVAVISGFLSGLSGFGAGLMLSAFLVPVAGAKNTVALLAVAMVITNLGRMAAFGHRPDLRRAMFVLAGAIPAMVPCAWLLTRLSDALAGFIVAVFLLASIASRRILKHTQLHVGPAGLVAGGAVVGSVSGLSTGGGVMIIPLLLGAGLGGAALITTDAAISLTLQIARSLAFPAFRPARRKPLPWRHHHRVGHHAGQLARRTARAAGGGGRSFIGAGGTGRRRGAVDRRDVADAAFGIGELEPCSAASAPSNARARREAQRIEALKGIDVIASKFPAKDLDILEH